MSRSLYTLTLDDDFKSDFKRLPIEVQRKVATVLDEFKADPHVCQRFLKTGFMQLTELRVNTSKWYSQRDEGRKLYRFKVYELEQDGHRYRVLYGFIPKTLHFVFLGVCHRSELDYDDENNQIHRRITATYDAYLERYR